MNQSNQSSVAPHATIANRLGISESSRNVTTVLSAITMQY